MFDLTGKVAVVTGAASGIGLATARRFRAAGAEVVLADIADGSAAAAELGGTWTCLDVSDEPQVQALMATTAEMFGRIDICVNNAGIAGSGDSVLQTSGDDLERTFAVNAMGVLYGMKHARRYMSPGSAVVNTASIAGVIGYPMYASYCASKWAVVGLTRVAALEFGEAGIRVNCVCPSTVDTEMLRTVPGGLAELSALQTAACLRGLIQADHVAAGIHFLASDDCPLITGQALVIDGGATAGVSPQVIDLASARAGVDG